MRILLGTAEEVIEILDLCGVDTTDTLCQLERVDVGTGWMVQESQCRICNFTSLDIAPMGADLDGLECSNCHAMMMQEYELPEWEREEYDISRLN